MGEGVGGIPGQLVGAEPTHAGGLGHGGEASAKAKAVGQPAELVLPFGEGGAAVGLAQLELAQQRGRGNQHAIVFNPGTIDRLPAAHSHGLADAGEQGRPVLGDPGVKGRGRVAEMELGVALHQLECRLESALRRPPGVRHRPEPGQIEVGVAEQLKTGRAWPQLGLGRLERPQGRGEAPWPIGGLGIGARQGRLQRSRRRRVLAPGRPQGHQVQGRAGQQPLGIGAIGGLQLQPALDQGTVVVAGAAQRKAEIQGFAPPPVLGQHPAAGGIEQVALMNRLAGDRQHHRLGPPTQHQPGPGRGPLLGPLLEQLAPFRRALQPQAQAQPLAAPGPDQQAAGKPIGPMAGAPRVVDRRTPGSVGAFSQPAGLQVAPRP